MAHLTAHHPLFAYSGQLVARVWRLFKNRQQANELAGLTDEQLKDIGLTRGDVRRALTLPLHSDPTSHLKTWALSHIDSVYCASPTAANTDLAGSHHSMTSPRGHAEIAA